MPKFATSGGPALRSPMTATRPTSTYEGAPGFVLDPMSELFSLMVTDMAGEPTFYESANDRLTRLQQAVRAATRLDPASVAAMIPWARNTANMRSVAIVAACEYAVEMMANPHDDFPTIRSVIDSACSRADEPAEILGYWWTFHGRKIPKGVKRGVADAAIRLYTEYSYLKYSGHSKAIKFGDVIELVHPKPKAPWQAALFKAILDEKYVRKSGDTEPDFSSLPTLQSARDLDATPTEERRAKLREVGTTGLYSAGWTWERLGGWLPGGMDAEAWETVIPAMGYMATIRNLRNFEEAGIGKESVRLVNDRISDPAAVAKSRQLPFRFWSAHKNSGSLKFAQALEEALELSLSNVPPLGGKSLVLIDVSGSMHATMSRKSTIMRWEAGAVLAAAIRGSGVDLVGFGTSSAKLKAPASILRTVQAVELLVRDGRLGGGTNLWTAVSQHYEGHKRVIVVTDMQNRDTLPEYCPVGKEIPVYVWDLGGYGKANIQPGKNRHVLAGLSDASFGLIKMLEAGTDAGWPWE